MSPKVSDPQGLLTQDLGRLGMPVRDRKRIARAAAHPVHRRIRPLTYVKVAANRQTQMAFRALVVATYRHRRDPGGIIFNGAMLWRRALTNTQKAFHP